jgi:hypothetical protein
MMLFRITATLSQKTVDGWTRIQQVPTFILDGDMHGLRTEIEAEAFGRRMLTDMMTAEAEALASVSAIQIDSLTGQVV